MGRTTHHRSAATGGQQRPAANGGRYITREQVAAARKRLDQIDRRLGIVDARLETAQRIKF